LAYLPRYSDGYGGTDFCQCAAPRCSGGPPRDGIPAIDNPLFVTITDAAEWLGLNEPVVSLRVGDTAKAYPLQILIYHEIVNDVIDKQPVAGHVRPAN